MHTTLEQFWAAGKADTLHQLLSAVSAYGRILDYVSWELGGAALGKRARELVRAATERGVAAKGSGAVGGDCIIALGFHPARLDAARRAWNKLGATVLNLGVDPDGVRTLLPTDGRAPDALEPAGQFELRDKQSCPGKRSGFGPIVA